MKTIMNQLLDALRERVTQNLATIRQNEAELRKILAEPLSNQRTYNLTNRHKVSKEILLENKENIEIQNKIVAFLSSHKDIPEYSQDLLSLANFESSLREKTEQGSDTSNEKKKANMEIEKGLGTESSDKISENTTAQTNSLTVANGQLADSIFKLTTNGDLAFNRAHPRFNDEGFYNQLLSYHTQREEYEICAQLKKTWDKAKK